MTRNSVSSEQALAGYAKFVSPADLKNLKALFAELDKQPASGKPTTKSQAIADKIGKVLKKYY